MSEAEKNQEYGKRSYQKFLLVIASGLVTLIVSGIIIVMLFTCPLHHEIKQDRNVLVWTICKIYV